MLKKDFFSAIENLLKAGFQPRFYTVNSGRIGLITFTDKNGTKQVEQVYSCTSLAANTFGKRFTTWLEEIFQKHNEEKVADSGFEVGSRVWDKLMYTLRTISEIRAGGVLVLDNGRISGFDTPANLLKTNAIYQDVYNSQTKGSGDFDEKGGEA